MIAICLLILFFSLATADVAGCKAQTAISDATFKNLIAAIGKASFSSDKEKVVAKFVAANLTLGFTGNQTMNLLSAFTFSSSKQTVVTTITPWVLGMTCSDMANILSTITFSSDKLDTLSALVNLVIDLKDNANLIIRAFTFSSDKSTAAQIIANATPISCVWGDVGFRPHVAFIIDVSGSMLTSMMTPSGKTMSRLQFVTSQLGDVLNTSLSSSQSFNIIAFSSQATAWQPGVVKKTQANIQSAIQFINALSPAGSTNMQAALNLAMSDKNVDGIVLLSDGEPDCCMTQMIASANIWSNAGVNRLNTIVVQAGGSAQPAATQFMCQLAATTLGVCRTNN